MGSIADSGTPSGSFTKTLNFSSGVAVEWTATFTLAPTDDNPPFYYPADASVETTNGVGVNIHCDTSNYPPTQGVADWNIDITGVASFVATGVSSVTVTGRAAITHVYGGVGQGPREGTFNGQTVLIDDSGYGGPTNLGSTTVYEQTATFWPFAYSYQYETFDLDLESITITNAEVAGNGLTNISGTYDPGSFDQVPDDMLVKIDGADGGEWAIPLSLSVGGDTWECVTTGLPVGEHTAQMMDNTRQWVLSNVFPFTVGPAPLQLALDTATGRLGGNAYFTGHSVNGTVLALDANLDDEGFEDAAAFSGGTPFTGQATADLAYGQHTLQIRDHNNTSDVSNVVTFSLAPITSIAWPLDPTWQNGIIERFEWLTDIMQSYSGVEQRRQVRAAPRRTIEMTHQPVNQYRTVYDLALKRAGSDQFAVPLWFERVRIASGLAEGSDSVTADIADLDFAVGQMIVIWANPALYEVNSIAAVAGNTITLAVPTQNAYLAGSSIIPAMTAWVAAEPSATRYADRALQATVQFTSDSYNDYAANLGAVLTYQGLPVLTAAPDEGPSATFKFERVRFDYDPTTGVRYIEDTMGFGAQSTQYNLWAFGRAGYNSLRAFLYALAGRMCMCWIPTFACDLIPTQDIGAADTAIVALRNDFEVFANNPALSGRTNIMIATRDGNFYCTALGAAAVVDDNTFSVVITPIGTAIPLSNILRISFITTARSDGDVNELMHHTDVNGPTTLSLVFKEIPNTRTDGSFAFDPSNVSGGFLTNFHQTFNVTDPAATPYTVSAIGQTAGVCYAELELDALNGQANSGYVFGLGPAGLSYAQVRAGQGGLFLITTAGGWQIVSNGGVVYTASGQDFPGMIGLAVNIADKEAWFRTFDLTRTDYSFVPNWNGSASADPNVAGSGFTCAQLTGEIFLYAACGPNVGLIATLNVGYEPFLMLPPVNYTAGWPDTE